MIEIYSNNNQKLSDIFIGKLPNFVKALSETNLQSDLSQMKLSFELNCGPEKVSEEIKHLFSRYGMKALVIF